MCLYLCGDVDIYCRHATVSATSFTTCLMSLAKNMCACICVETWTSIVTLAPCPHAGRRHWTAASVLWVRVCETVRYHTIYTWERTSTTNSGKQVVRLLCFVMQKYKCVLVFVWRRGHLLSTCDSFCNQFHNLSHESRLSPSH